MSTTTPRGVSYPSTHHIHRQSMSIPKNVSVSQYGGNVNNTIRTFLEPLCVCLSGQYRSIYGSFTSATWHVRVRMSMWSCRMCYLRVSFSLSEHCLCVCVCVRERERVCVCEREKEYVCEIERVCVRERIKSHITYAL